MKRALALWLLPLLALGACKRGDELAEATATDVPDAVAAQRADAPVVESEFGTPVKDRVATIGLLNKRNNLIQDLVMKPGESRRIGNVIVKLATCERTLPWENPPQTGAFVQVFVEERATADQALAWHKIFSGWLFKNSPSLNVVEHPVYDVWIKDCAMKFPGEEENPADFAAPSSAPKPSGSPAAAPEAAASAPPAPTPAASAATPD
ncbi:MAG: hypothetical protein RLZZ84_710 [Pseudomonadota bacterium]